MEKCDSLVRGHILHMRALREEHNSSTACNDVDPRPTLRTGVHRIYLSVSHLLHTRRPSYLRAFLYKIGNVEGEVLYRLIDLDVVLPGVCRPEPVVVFLQSTQQTHPRLRV